MPTMLTWCEGCGEDMHQNGGVMCDYCGNEYCYECIINHSMSCRDANDEKQQEEPK